MNDRKGCPLTVLHIFSGDLWAGAEVMIFNLLDKLRDDKDIKVIALSLNEGILTNKLRSKGIESYVIPEAFHSFPIIFLNAYTSLRNKRIEIIHSHRYKENLLALLLAKAMRVRHLLTTNHGLSEPELTGQNGKQTLYSKLNINDLILNRYFKVVAVSREMARTLVQTYHFSDDRVDVIYNGVDTESACWVPRYLIDGRIHIGTVGRMVPVKDFPLFLQVAAQIRRITDKVRFSILGDGPLREELIRIAKDLRIEDCVEFLSPRVDLREYYQSLDIYLNTSVREGMPLSILEAMASGKPVVGPRVGGIPEIILHAEHGLLADKRDPGEFLSLCMKLIRDEDLRTTLGKKASERVAATFDSSRMADAYKQLYLEQCRRFSS